MLGNQWDLLVMPTGEVRYAGLKFASIAEALDIAEVPADERTTVRRNLRRMEDMVLPILNGCDDDEDDEA